jgi:hypothetical protein
METKRYTLSTTLKVLMRQTPLVITKNQVTHPKYDQLCAYHLPKKEKTQVRWVVVIGRRAQK